MADSYSVNILADDDSDDCLFKDVLSAVANG